MAHEVGAFLLSEEAEGGRHQLDDLVEGTWTCGAEKRFQFGKREFDRIEVRTVRRQEADAGARPFNGGVRLR